MSVEYHVSEQDCRDFLSRFTKARMHRLYWIASAILLILFCLIALTSPHPASAAVMALAGFLVYLILSALLLREVVKARAQQLVNSFGPEYFTTPKTLTLTESGMEFRTNFGQSLYFYSAVEKVSRDDRFVTVSMRGNMQLFIPTATPGLADVYDELSAKIGAPPKPVK